MFKVPGMVFVFTFEEYSKKAALVPHGAMYIVNVVLSELSREEELHTEFQKMQRQRTKHREKYQSLLEKS